MADQATATLLREGDAGKTTRISFRSGRVSVVEWYLINTADEVRAAKALGLPVDGAIYGGLGVSDLAVVDRDIAYTHGTDDPSTGLGGWSLGEIRYEQPGGGGRLPTASTALKYSQDECTTSGVQVKYGILADGSGDGPDNQPIANGDGVSKDVGGSLLTIVTFLTGSQFTTLWPRLIELQWGQKYNADPVIAPPKLGTLAAVTIPPGWAQYQSFRTEYPGGTGGLIQLSQTLKIVPDGYLAKWRQVDSLGNPLSSILSTPIYERVNFAGLW